MPAPNQVELVVTVDVDKANRSLKTVNASFNGLEQSAATATARATANLGGLETMLLKGMTAANLLGGAVRGLIDLIKEWTIESAKLAARNETLLVVNTQLGRVNGYSADSLDRLVNRIKALGITTQASRDSVNKMIEAQMDLSKATDLARMAQDAAVISGQNSSQAFEGILHGIATQNVRVLRTYGLNVDFGSAFEKEKLRLGRELTDIEKKNAAFEIVLGKAKIIAGAYEASMGTVGKQLTSLDRYVEEAKNALGQHFLPELRKVISALTELADWVRGNSDFVASWAKGLGSVVVGIAVGKFIGWMGEIRIAINAITLAMANNPITLAATAIAVGGSIIFKTYQEMKERQDEAYQSTLQSGERNKIAGLVKSGKSLADIKKLGYTEDKIKDALTQGRKEDPDSLFTKDKLDFGVKLGLQNDEQLKEVREQERLKLQHAMVTQQEEGLKSTRESLLRSTVELSSAESTLAKQRIQDAMRIIDLTTNDNEVSRESVAIAQQLIAQRKEMRQAVVSEEAREIEKRSQFLHDGKMVTRKLSPGELSNIHAETANKLSAVDLKFNEEETRFVEQMWKAAAARSAHWFQTLFVEPLRQQGYIYEQNTAASNQRQTQGFDIEKGAVDSRMSLQLAQLETINAVTVKDKIAVERMKTAIEVDAINKRTEIELRAIDFRTGIQVAEARKAAMAQGIFQEESLEDISSKIRAISEDEKAALSKTTSNQVAVETAKGAAAVKTTTQQYYQSIFQSLKEQAGGVFDALLTKSESVWKAIGNSLKTALLTAIKDVVTSRIAVMLMNMFVPGAATSMKQGGGFGKQAGGLLGVLGIGAVPSFGAAGGISTPTFMPQMDGGGLPISATPAAIIASQLGMAGGGGLVPVIGPGGTPTFVKAGSASASGGFGSLKSLLTAKNAYTGLALLGGGLMLGGVQKRSAFSTIGGGAMMGAGIGLAGGPIGAIGGAGIGLALDGLRRGGIGGLGETTAGGAMLGWNVGGPMGAAIGAAAGFVAGLIRLGIKGASEKAHDKIKQIYGVDISDQKFLQQIVSMANQTYGGNLDVAIRSRDIRDLILLYAQSTGQSSKGMPVPMSSLSIAQTGGSLYQTPGYQNGSQMSGAGGLPTLDSIGSGSASGGGGTIVIPLSIDSRAVGSVIIQDGRVVSQGALSAMKSSNGRREMTALQVSPGLVTS